MTPHLPVLTHTDTPYLKLFVSFCRLVFFGDKSSMNPPHALAVPHPPAPAQPFILSVGSMALDSVATPDARVEEVLGGSGNYFSLAASFYCPVSLIGIIGEDFPAAELQNLADHGVDISGVERAPGKTLRWSGSYDAALGDVQTLSLQLNVFKQFQPKLSQTHQQAPYLFLGNIDPCLQLSILEQTPHTQWILADSMNHWIANKRSDLERLLKRIDMLCLNETEAFMLAGLKPTAVTSPPLGARDALGPQPEEEVIARVRALGPQWIIIKRGASGADLYTPRQTFHVPAYAGAHVKDPTGAGDSFSGGLLGALARAQVRRAWSSEQPDLLDETLWRALISGTATASFTIEDFSLRRLLTLTRPELEAREQRLLQEIAYATTLPPNATHNQPSR